MCCMARFLGKIKKLPQNNEGVGFYTISYNF